MARRGVRTRTTAHESDAAPALDNRDISAAELAELAISIRSIRKSRGMTQAELGIAIGTEQTAIARLESGKHAPSFRTLQAIARATRTRLHLDYRPYPPPNVAVQMRKPTMSALAHNTRRQFVGSTMGLATLLGLGPVRQISAQEATAAASTAASYVWTPPQYDPEPSLFTVIDRNDQTVTVETIDGQIEIPADPQRVVALGWEYISLFELGVTDRLIAVAGTEPELMSVGNLTEEMHAALANVARLPSPWEIDVELIVELNPDLILASPGWTPDPTVFAQIAPTIRGNMHALNVPRSAVRDFGALFDRADIAADLMIEHEAFIERARHAVAPVVAEKKAVALYPDGDEFLVYPSYFIDGGGILAFISGPYQLQRELGITPSSFVEHLADDDDRQSPGLFISMEQIGEMDADYIFAHDFEGSFDAFVSNPLVRQSVAAQHDQIYAYDADGFGRGLAGVRSSVAWMVETLTGEPFE